MKISKVTSIEFKLKQFKIMEKDISLIRKLWKTKKEELYKLKQKFWKNKCSKMAK